MMDAAQKTLPKKVRNQPEWFTQHAHELKKLIDARNSAISAKIARPTRLSVTRLLRKCRKKLKSAINRAKNEWIGSLCKGLNDAKASQRGTKICWDKVKTLRKGLIKPKPPLEKMMVKEDGTKCSSAEENAEVFRTRFQKLYSRSPDFDPSIIELLEQMPTVNELHHNPSDEEILAAIRHLNKSQGESGLTPLMFKALIQNNSYLKRETYPDPAIIEALCCLKLFIKS